MAIQAFFGFLGRDHSQRSAAQGRLAGQVTPGDIAQGTGRARFHAFGMALAKEALGDFLTLLIKVDHVPRTGSLAQTATNACKRIHDAGAGNRVGDDGVLGTGRGAGNGVRALPAGFRNEPAASPGALHPNPAGWTLRTEVKVPAHLDSGHGRLGTAVVEFGAGQFTIQAAHTAARVGQKEPFRVVDDDNGCIRPPTRPMFRAARLVTAPAER